MDAFFSFVCIVAFSWLFLIIAICIKVDSKGAVLFRQNRIGRNKKNFDILKFRTMRSDTPKDIPTANLENPDLYITKSGALLRKTSLDELPQLINILRGEMSFVGPRPALWNQDDLILLREKYGANSVRPGLTGLAQISGRDELDISAKASYDAKYVEKITFPADLKIFILTFVNVLIQKGIKEGH
jgi:O-antigen biosynthesis protein WbqP